METREWIRRAMQRLPIEQRRVLELAYGARIMIPF
jgi:DNA-directed RNA polymerase specialized sigma24 family protein